MADNIVQNSLEFLDDETARVSGTIIGGPFVIEWVDDEDNTAAYRSGNTLAVETSDIDGESSSTVFVGNMNGGGTYPLESADDFKVDKKKGIITFNSRGTIYTVRAYQDTDGMWASSLSMNVPAQALEEMVVQEDLNMYSPKGDVTQEELYAAVDPATGTVKYVVYSSPNGMYIRSSGGWFKVPPTDESLDGLEVRDIDKAFIDTFDKAERANEKLTVDDVIEPVEEIEPIMAAAGDACPVATQDIKTNIANREKAIADGGYGPLNPNDTNPVFWAGKARRWSVTPREAKKSLCGNCVMFIRTPKMLDCIASGIEAGGSGEGNAWDAVDQAELGFCEAFDFKCAASRTCDAWVVGGPITEEETK